MIDFVRAIELKMSTYQLLGCQGSDSTRDGMLSVLKSNASSYCDQIMPLNVPLSLKFGTFDSLIKLMDDLSKTDGTVETILRRVERQMYDLAGSTAPDFQILSFQRVDSVEAYIHNFTWDNTKFPSNRYLADNLSSISSTVGRIDEDVKARSFTYQDVKTSLMNMSKLKGPGTSLTAVDLVDILTPDVVSPDDFVVKEHMTTVLVVVPRDNMTDFLKGYEKVDPFVVPRSAKQFMKITKGVRGPISDKDGNTLWRVVCFKSSIEAVRKGLKECKCNLREFTYSPTAYKEQLTAIDKTDAELQQKEKELKRLLGCAFSDIFVAWMHLKAMRVFVESVLRYGVPANFHAFMVRIPNARSVAPLRAILSDRVFKNSAQFGQAYILPDKSADAGEEEAYYPYVCLPFSALAPAKE